jgi:hypothetical protein
LIARGLLYIGIDKPEREKHTNISGTFEPKSSRISACGVVFFERNEKDIRNLGDVWRRTAAGRDGDVVSLKCLSAEAGKSMML